MEYKKITESDLIGKGVVGQPDTPALSALEMQKKVEEIVRDVVIPAFNQLIDAVVEDMGNRYTKDEVTASIAEKIVQLGAGDMSMGVYDTDSDGIVDKAAKLAQKIKVGNAYFDGSSDITLGEIGAATTQQGVAVDRLTTDIKAIKYVLALPENPDINTLYLVKK
jgi:hypothetical protein